MYQYFALKLARVCKLFRLMSIRSVMAFKHKTTVFIVTVYIHVRFALTLETFHLLFVEWNCLLTKVYSIVNV